MSDEAGLRKDLTAEEFSLFRDWIHQHSGIFLEESKTDSLRISLVTRASRFGITDYSDYFRLLSADEDEFKELMNLVTINETSFFRFPAQFDALRDVVVPRVLESRAVSAGTPFRVWSAGCSTGEEPYTIAMTLLDSALGSLGSPFDVVGTDVSTQALERAKSAVYPQRALASLSDEVIARWFEPVDGGWKPRERVRDVCDFHYQNLIREPYGTEFLSNWDVIFCRNVTIYFRMESTTRVVEHFYDALNPGGYLFIGHSETLTTVSDRFETVEADGVFLYRKPPARHSFTFDDIASARRRRSSLAGASLKPRQVNEADAEQLRRARRAARQLAAQAATANDPAPLTLAPEPEPETLSAAARAHALLDEARAVDALELASLALAEDPDDVEAQLVIAYAHADLGNLETAAEQAARILAANPLVAPARYILGAIRREQGDLDGALAEFRRTLYIDSEFVLAHFALASIHAQRGERTEAAREYENTLRALYLRPEGAWTTFLGGFKPDLLAQTCERGLIECRRGRSCD
ncbi:MAG TPA: CheR family methyltransferase [Coriobacteriia bacterium]|nr:CheR family methyltransferase [Coriobacteriia bacterium]